MEVLRIPHLGTAEEDVLLATWSVAEGEAVRRGQTVAVVETLKAAFDVEAETDGVLLRRLHAAGERLPVRTPLAVLGAVGEPIDEAGLPALLTTDAAMPAEPAAPVVAPRPFSGGSQTSAIAGAATTTGLGEAEPAAAPAARRRALELDVDLRAVRGTGRDGLIRVADVEAAAPADGALDPAFLAHLRRDRAAFAALGSDFKVALYRRHGARIGADCRIAPGAVLLAERIVLGPGAHFGEGCTVECRDLMAGELLHLGARCRVRASTLRFGDNAFLTDDIEIGGGGALDPEAALQIGSHGFVGEHVHLNPCRPLRIGDEVVISRNAVVMTHSFGGSALHGYPVRFAGVSIGDGAQIGIGAVLFPGVSVGAGAIVLSGSSVVTAVPAGRLWGGVPAVDLKAAAVPLSPEQFAARALELHDEFLRQLELRGRRPERATSGDERRATFVVDGRRHALRWTPAPEAPPLAGHAEEVRLLVACADAAWSAQPATITAIDLSRRAVQGASGPLADALREFLRKRGVRLHPRSWAYRGGWL